MIKRILFISVVAVLLASAVADGPPAEGSIPSNHRAGGGVGGGGGEAGASIGVGFGASAGVGSSMGAGTSGNDGGKGSAFASQSVGTGKGHHR